MADAASGRRRAPAGRGHNVSISLERISDLIGAIYDCVLAPQNWEATIDHIREEFLFANGGLAVTPLRPGAQILHTVSGLEPQWAARITNYETEIAELWGGPQRIAEYPLDEPIIHSQTPGFVDRHLNRYFREWVEPQGIIDAVAVALAKEPSLVGYVTFGRHGSVGAIGDAEVSGLRLLAPHFRRAVTISNLFDLKAIEAKTFSSALDALSVGVVLIDEELGIVHANAAADAMLTEGDPIRSSMGTLTLPAKPANDALLGAVQRAARDDLSLGQRGIGIPAERLSGDPCVVHVLPLRGGEMRRGLVQRAAAAIFVAPGNASPRMPTDALALLYDLTPAEARVLELVCAAKTRDAIAATLGIATSTVKTHLLHVFAKTGCKRQADLVRLAANLSLPV